ncbi:hypothetical protein OKW21_004682 [Catalinimonas alkaloidigena]|uniref:hypothetical protein n=1 Tax=Catalinimonas alkaloidigena TaxID=1075417 RepID=UPI002404E189|nr:hypothetical protein [Catalinimonas alkaloidigena]MDF9799419.1 hypothetical protein [Catalinimonas alkaloidigena]
MKVSHLRPYRNPLILGVAQTTSGGKLIFQETPSPCSERWQNLSVVLQTGPDPGKDSGWLIVCKSSGQNGWSPSCLRQEKAEATGQTLP